MHYVIKHPNRDVYYGLDKSGGTHGQYRYGFVPYESAIQYPTDVPSPELEENLEMLRINPRVFFPVVHLFTDDGVDRGVTEI